jgi:hypothetical protein
MKEWERTTNVNVLAEGTDAVVFFEILLRCIRYHI